MDLDVQQSSNSKNKEIEKALLKQNILDFDSNLIVSVALFLINYATNMNEILYVTRADQDVGRDADRFWKFTLWAEIFEVKDVAIQ